MFRSTIIVFFALLASLAANPLVYEGESGPGKGSHIVFLASDHEYRTEETCPALARILARHHGFKCTVLFGLDKNGEIEAGASNIPGMQALEQADLLVIFTRFLNLPDDQMAHLDAYLERGGPVVGMRTASHAFKIPAGSKYAKYDYRSKVPGYEKGFGHQVLGNTWVGHYGKNHKQGTRIEIVPEQKDHVILRGVKDRAFCHAGGYVGEVRDGFTVLTNSQPLVSMDPDSKADPKKPPMPSTWTRHYESKDGGKHRVFHSTQGASLDLLDDSYRRLLINGIFWASGKEASIQPDMNIAFVGPFKPSRFSFGGHVKGVKPADLAEWTSPIMPASNSAPNKPRKNPAKPAK